MCALTTMALAGCTPKANETEGCGDSCCKKYQNAVIENIMTRRSIRKYEERPVDRDTLATILECGVYAPNAMNKQCWEIRVVDNKEFIDGATEVFKQSAPAQMTSDPEFKNMFRNAPTVVFVACEKGQRFSQIDCGLLGENIMLAAWSMGIGSCCLGSSAAFFTSPALAEYLKKLEFSENYELVYCIGLGYPAEEPAAKERNMDKIKFIE